MSDREQIIETLRGLKRIQPKVIEKDIDEAIELIELLRAYENRPNDKYWYQQGRADERYRIVNEIQNVGNRYCNNVHCDMECISCEHGSLMRAIVEIVRGGENE